MVAMVLTPPSGWDPRHFGKWSLKLPHESSSQPAKSRFKKKWMPNAPVELLCCKYFCPWTHWNLPFRGRSSIGKTHPQDTRHGLTSLANDGPMTPEGNTWKNSSIKKQLPHLRKVLLSSAPASLAPPWSKKPFGKVDLQPAGDSQKSRLGNHLGLFFPRCFQSSVHLSADLVLHHCHLRKDCFPRWPPVHSKGPQQKQNWCNKAWGDSVCFPTFPRVQQIFPLWKRLQMAKRDSKTYNYLNFPPNSDTKSGSQKNSSKNGVVLHETRFAQETRRPPSIDLAQHGCCHHHGRRPKRPLCLNWGRIIPS